MTGLTIYRGMMRLYPAELRRDFGGEMLEIFVDDLSDGWRTRGLAGAVLVWWCALCEVFRIALPELGSNPAIAVPVISFVLNALVVRSELMLGMSPNIGQPVALTSIVCASIALVVVRTGKVSVTSLQLK